MKKKTLLSIIMLMVYVVNEGQNEFIIDTSKYKKGNYILNLIREGKIIESRQILKK